MDRLSMSLDDVIAQKLATASTAGSNKRKNNSTGPSRAAPRQKSVRSAPYEDRQRRTEAPVFRAPQVVSNQQNLSVFARIGKPPVSGTNVTFANLKSSVGEKDVQDLCGAIGEVKEINFSNGRTGRNSAVVLFARRSDAVTCVTKLNGMTLDGSPMEVSITGEPIEFIQPKSVFDRLEPAQKNVRAGLFGTAIDSSDDTSSSSSGPSFAVTLGGSDSFGRQTKLVQPFAVGTNAGKSGLVQPFGAKKEPQEGPRFLFRDESDKQQQTTRGLRQPFSQGQGQGRPRSAGASSQQDRRPNRGNNNASSRGSNNSSNNRGSSNSNNNKDRNARPERQAKPTASASDLDADLDSYFAKK